MKRKHEERKRYAPAFDQMGHVSDRRRNQAKAKPLEGRFRCSARVKVEKEGGRDTCGICMERMA